MAKVGPQRAAELTGRSKSTIQRAMNSTIKFAQFRLTMVENPRIITDNFKPVLPSWIPQWVYALYIGRYRQRAIQMLNSEGYGDLTDEEYRHELLRDYKAVEEQIGNNKFILGDKISEADCHVFAWLVNFRDIDLPEMEPCRQGKLRAYLDRVQALLFPDKANLTLGFVQQSFTGEH